jgi:hypothetical protein
MRMIRTICVAIAITLSACAPPHSPGDQLPASRDLSAAEPDHSLIKAHPDPVRIERWAIDLPNDESPHTYTCIIEYPDTPGDRAAMLFSGGLVADLHWTVPGSVENLGETIELTMDGRPTRDGDTIAQALLDAEFIVIRYSSLRSDQTVESAGPIPFATTAELATTAWRQALKRTGFPASRVGIVAHSLGAPRSVFATQGRAGGYVFLAGAYLSPTSDRPSQLARRVDQTTIGIDYDKSGAIALWERAAAQAIAAQPRNEGKPLTIRGITYLWPSETLGVAGAPVLAIWGGLDTMSYHAPVLESILGDQVTTEYYSALGHQLSVKVGDKVGPIDAAVVESLVDWLVRTIPAVHPTSSAVDSSDHGQVPNVEPQDHPIP